MLSKLQIEKTLDRKFNPDFIGKDEALAELHEQIQDGCFVHCSHYGQFISFQKAVGRELKFIRDVDGVRGLDLKILIILEGTMQTISQCHIRDEIMSYCRSYSAVWHIYDW